MTENTGLDGIIEALFIAAENGISIDEIKKALDGIAEDPEILAAIGRLKEEYVKEERAFHLMEVAGRYRIATKPKYVKWINNLYKIEPERLTGPALESLAILAYKQPATRAEIEAVRGVGVGGVLNTLLEKGLIKIKGRKEVIGRPLLYATTEKFLELFGLNSLDDLPALRTYTQEDLEFGKKDESQLVPKEGDADREGEPKDADPSGHGTHSEGESTEYLPDDVPASVDDPAEPEERHDAPDDESVSGIEETSK
ncbi:MAG: SMC-Scp complex subunit ScpB [Candidatus Omnitrophica bacterium]|nr:SMC-Scp complex subunit ScpB [Candidatus Omnitrophota bacterium]